MRRLTPREPAAPGITERGTTSVSKEIEGCLNCSIEFCAQTWPLAFVPRGSFDRLKGSSLKNADAAHQRRLMHSRMRFANSWRSRVLAAPVSTSSSRRRISSSHALATVGSVGPSRLLTRSWASSALSAWGSSSASLRKRSVFRLAIASTSALNDLAPARIAHIAKRSNGGRLPSRRLPPQPACRQRVAADRNRWASQSEPSRALL